MSPGDESPSNDSLVEQFLSGYRLYSFAGLTWGWLKTYHDLALALPRFHPTIPSFRDFARLATINYAVLPAIWHNACLACLDAMRLTIWQTHSMKTVALLSQKGG